MAILNVVLFMLLTAYCYGFLLDTSTSNPLQNGEGGAVTDRHFIQLMDMLYEEKTARKQLEQRVIKLQRQFSTTLTSLKLNYSTLVNELAKLKVENTKLKFNNGNVALQAWADHKNDANGILVFSRIRNVYGIHDLTSFKSTGIFRAEVAGLYLVSVTINANKASSFNIFHNDTEQIRVIIQGDTNVADQSGTGVIVVNMAVNDTVKVMVPADSGISMGQYSTINIIKVK